MTDSELVDVALAHIYHVPDEMDGFIAELVNGRTTS